MQIDMPDHTVRVAQHRDYTVSLIGLTLNDLEAINTLIQATMPLTGNGTATAGDAQLEAFAAAWATMTELARPMTGSFDAQLPWVHR